MRLQLRVLGPAIELDNHIAAIPLVLARLRRLAWAADGAAIVDGETSRRLRVVDGIGGQPGGTYQYLDPDSDEPITFTVTRDDAEVVEVTGEVAPDPGVVLNGAVTLVDPGDPLTVRAVGTLHAASLPGIVGREMSGDFTARLRDFATSPEPQVSVRITSRHGTADSVAHVVSTGDRWQVDVDLDVRLRGLATLATPVLLLTRRRIAEAITEQIDRALTEVATDLATGHGPTGTPEEIADQAWQSLVAALRRPA